MSLWQKESTLGKVPPPYPPEVRVEAVRMVRDRGALFEEVGKIVGCSAGR